MLAEERPAAQLGDDVGIGILGAGRGDGGGWKTFLLQFLVAQTTAVPMTANHSFWGVGGGVKRRNICFSIFCPPVPSLFLPPTPRLPLLRCPETVNDGIRVDL